MSIPKSIVIKKLNKDQNKFQASENTPIFKYSLISVNGKRMIVKNKEFNDWYKISLNNEELRDKIKYLIKKVKDV